MALASLVIRFKSFYYYLKHTEINFDNDSKENNEMSKYTDNQTKEKHKSASPDKDKDKKKKTKKDKNGQCIIF